MTAKTNKTWKWSIGLAVCIYLYWAIHYFENGSIPYIHSISLIGKELFVLPFELPRWWDILTGPLFAWTLGKVYEIGKQSKSSMDKGYSVANEAGAFALIITVLAHLAFLLGFYENGIIGGIVFGGIFEIAGLLFILVMSILRMDGDNEDSDFI